MSVISVDYFGNLDKYSVIWLELLKYVKLEGIKVYIISGPWPNHITNRLEAEGYKRRVHYDDVFSILSHLSLKGLETWFDETHDSWYSDSERWWAAKAEICKEISSQIHFDNDIRFKDAFRHIATRFIHTDCQEGRKQVAAWREKLRLANTFYDPAEEYHEMFNGMTGFSM